MTELMVTDILAVGEGSASQTAALAAGEEGCNVILLGSRRPPSTAISIGFLTFEACEDFDRSQLFEAMSQVTSTGLCDSTLLRRLLDEARKTMADVIAADGIPVDRERGLRTRRAVDKGGRDLLSGLPGAVAVATRGRSLHTECPRRGGRIAHVEAHAGEVRAHA